MDFVNEYCKTKTEIKITCNTCLSVLFTDNDWDIEEIMFKHILAVHPQLVDKFNKDKEEERKDNRYQSWLEAETS